MMRISIFKPLHKYGIRCFCAADQNSHCVDLMRMDRVITPNPLFSIYNILVNRTIIRSVAGGQFSWIQFMNGAKQAILIASQKVAAGSFDDLEGLLVPESLNEVRENWSSWPLPLRSKIGIGEKDMLFFAPYKTDIKKENSNHRIEISVLLQYVPGLNSDGPAFLSLTDFKDLTYVANYSFLRFYKDRQAVSSWIISRLNHFSHKDEFEKRLRPP